ALAQSRRAQLLARLQAVDDDLLGQTPIRLEQRAYRIEQARLRSRVEVEQNVPGRQQRGDLAHDLRRSSAPRRAGSGLRTRNRRRRRRRGVAALDRGAFVAMQLALFLVLDHLAVELVGERVD